MGQAETTEVGEAAVIAARSASRRPRFSFAYTNAIDVKGRLVLPVPYRPHFADGGMVTIWRGPSLAAMTFEDFDAYADGLGASLALSGEEDPAAVIDVMWAHSVQVKLDLQGRISIPDGLRAMAGLDGDVRIRGLGDRVEMRPVDDSPERVADIQDHITTLEMLQSAHGLPPMGD